MIGLRNDAGQVGCSIFNDAQAFPRDDSKVLHHVWAPIHAGKAVCEFTGLAPGDYAAVVFHDENGDHEFNMNAFGMPMEGYGFSNDAAALFAPPDFKSAGPHFSPAGHSHESTPAGDIPDFSLIVGKDGTAHVSTVAPNVTLGDDDHSVFSNGGTAIVIHAVAGGTGTAAPPRIACGVITRS